MSFEFQRSFTIGFEPVGTMMNRRFTDDLTSHGTVEALRNC